MGLRIKPNEEEARHLAEEGYMTISNYENMYSQKRQLYTWVDPPRKSRIAIVNFGDRDNVSESQYNRRVRELRKAVDHVGQRNPSNRSRGRGRGRGGYRQANGVPLQPIVPLAMGTKRKYNVRATQAQPQGSNSNVSTSGYNMHANTPTFAPQQPHGYYMPIANAPPQSAYNSLANPPPLMSSHPGGYNSNSASQTDCNSYSTSPSPLPTPLQSNPYRDERRVRARYPQNIVENTQATNSSHSGRHTGRVEAQTSVNNSQNIDTLGAPRRADYMQPGPQQLEITNVRGVANFIPNANQSSAATQDVGSRSQDASNNHSNRGGGRGGSHYRGLGHDLGGRGF